MATIKARKAEIQVLIDRQEFDALFNEEDTNLMNELTGWGFPMYKRIFNPSFPTDTRCVAHSVDGNKWQVWSWNKALSERDNLREALRRSVRDQITAYSAIAENECAQCGSDEYLTIDHKTVSFNAMVAYLLRMLPNAREGLGNDGDGSGWYIKDKELEWVWQDLHHKLADYQVLCRSCNSKKGAKHGNA